MSRQRNVLVTLPGGDVVSAKVWEVVDAAADPDLGQRLLSDTPDRALNTVSAPDGTWVPIAVPVVYHDPANAVFAVVLPETDRHRELEARAAMFTELARDTSAAIPAYVRGFEVVFGARGLRAHLERIAERILADQRLAEIERERGAHERRRAELSAREAELERRSRELDAAEIDLARRVAELAAAEAELTQRLGELERRQVENERTRVTTESGGLRLERTRRGSEPPPPPPGAGKSAPEPRTSDGGPRRRRANSTLEGIPPVARDVWSAWFATSAVPAALTIEDGRVRAALCRPDASLARDLTRLELRVQLHRMPRYPVVALIIDGGESAAGGEGDRGVLVLDIASDADQRVLTLLERDVAFDLDLWQEGADLGGRSASDRIAHEPAAAVRRHLGRAQIRAPLAENLRYITRAAHHHLRSIAPGQHDFAAAAAAVVAAPGLIEGLDHPQHGEFRADKLEQLATAHQVRRALAMTRRFNRPDGEDYLATIRSFPLERWWALRAAVLERAVAMGLWMGVELAQAAVSEGLARSRKDLIRKLERGFAALLANPIANDLDPDAIDDNRNALAGEAAALGVATSAGSDAVASGVVSAPSRRVIGRDQSVAELIELLDDRRHRLDAALELCDRRATEALRSIMQAVRRMPRAEAVRVLATAVAFGTSAAPVFIAGLASSKAFLRQGCALALSMVPTDAGTEALIEILLSEPTEIWRELARAIGHIGLAALTPMAARLGRLGDRATAADLDRLAWAMAVIAARGGHGAIESLAGGSSGVAAVARMALERTELAGRDDVTPVDAEPDLTLNREFSRRFFAAVDSAGPARNDLDSADPTGAMELIDDELLEDEPDDGDADELQDDDLVPG